MTIWDDLRKPALTNGSSLPAAESYSLVNDALAIEAAELGESQAKQIASLIEHRNQLNGKISAQQKRIVALETLLRELYDKYGTQWDADRHDRVQKALK